MLINDEADKAETDKDLADRPRTDRVLAEPVEKDRVAVEVDRAEPDTVAVEKAEAEKAAEPARLMVSGFRSYRRNYELRGFHSSDSTMF